MGNSQFLIYQLSRVKANVWAPKPKGGSPMTAHRHDRDLFIVILAFDDACLIVLIITSTD